MFKVNGVLSIIAYMFLKMFPYYWGLIFKPSQEQAWVKREFVKWANFSLRKLRMTVQVHDKEKLNSVNWERNVFIMGNHASYSDIPVLISTLNRVIGFVAKYELKYIPFLNYWMKKIGCVLLKRQNYKSSVKKLKKLETEGSVKHLVIFPEGTRSKTGKVGEFKYGVLKLAWQLEVVFLPLFLKGTRAGWEDRKNPGTTHSCEITIGDSIDLKEYKKDHDFNDFYALLTRLYADKIA